MLYSEEGVDAREVCSMLGSKRVGIAFGGGGARGAAHLGVLRHLEELGLRPDCIAGTSAGAVVAALWAFGLPLAVIEKELRALKAVDLRALRLNELGLFDNTGVRALLEALLPEGAAFEDARLPLAVTATDLVTGRAVILDRGPVVPAVLASCCVPGVYLPVELGGRLLVDGGLTENVPLSALRSLGARVTIGVDLNGPGEERRPEGLIDVVSKAMDIAIDSQTRHQLRAANVVISMDLARYSRTSAADFDALFEEGYKAARHAVSSVASLQRWLRLNRWWRFLLSLWPFRLPDVLRHLLPAGRGEENPVAAPEEAS